MKLLFISLVASLCVAGSLGTTNASCTTNYQCTHSYDVIPNQWMDMNNTCASMLKSQVQVEVKAAITYLSMGAHFARDTVNRPGFSKFFFEAASEEREHAIKIIEYLLMRGELTTNIGELLSFSKEEMPQEGWLNGKHALEQALILEANVTHHLHKIIAKCEHTPSNKEPPKTLTNDYHLVDYLSGDFLDEQYKGQRDLAGKLTTLSKMVKLQEDLGEFLFDKKLLNGEI